MAEDDQPRTAAETAALLAALAAAGLRPGKLPGLPGTGGNVPDDVLDDYAGNARGQAEAIAALTVTAQAAIAASWRDFSDWYSTTAIGALVREHAAQLVASKRQVANVTNAYLSRTTSMTRGRRVSPVKLIDVTAVRRDAFTGQAQTTDRLLHTFGRPADLYRYEMTQGLDEVDVLDDVVQRAEAIVADELLLAQRGQEEKFMADAAATITGYRRVIHPELSLKSGVCGLCIAASDRVYHKENAQVSGERGDLRELHTGCNCTVLAILDGEDPGSALNGRDLGNLYRIAGSSYADDLIRTRFKVMNHGELGPVLTYADQNPMLPAEVRRHQNTRRLPGENPGASRRRNQAENAAR